ncbi:MAG: Ig-like domain-containing protein [Patulibacter minatonensis]
MERTTFRTSVPPSVVVPGKPDDAAPTAAFTDPAPGATVAVGKSLSPVVLARDDFGISKVAFSVAGTTTTLTRAPYEFAWAPTAADAGKVFTLTAVATDSSGQTATATLDVRVLDLPDYPGYPTATPIPTATPTPTPGTTPAPTAPPTPAPTPAPVAAPRSTATPIVLGTPEVGETVICLPGSWKGEPDAYAYQWLRAGTPDRGCDGEQLRARPRRQPPRSSRAA